MENSLSPYRSAATKLRLRPVRAADAAPALLELWRLQQDSRQFRPEVPRSRRRLPHRYRSAALLSAPVPCQRIRVASLWVIQTAPDEFVFVGANGAPSFAVDSPGPSKVAISSKDEGRFDKGKWMPGRRLNGDEAGAGLPNGQIGMLKVKLVRFD